jgi:dUTP pyrophosphatase
VKTGLSIAIPAGTYARVAPRSGLAVKHFVDTGAGVVDEDYRGEVGVVLFNHGEADFQGAHNLWRCCCMFPRKSPSCLHANA